jgi:hypothetical protein
MLPASLGGPPLPDGFVNSDSIFPLAARFCRCPLDEGGSGVQEFERLLTARVARHLDSEDDSSGPTFDLRGQLV